MNRGQWKQSITPKRLVLQSRLLYTRGTKTILRASSVVAFVEPLPYTVEPPGTLLALPSRRREHRINEGAHEPGRGIVHQKQ